MARLAALPKVWEPANSHSRSDSRMYPAAILFELFLEVGDDLCNPCSWPDVRVIHEFPPAWGGGGPLYGSAVVRSQWLPADPWR